jgi:hypothetical protein
MSVVPSADSRTASVVFCLLTVCASYVTAMSCDAPETIVGAEPRRGNMWRASPAALRPVAAALALSLAGHTKAAALATGELPGEGAADGSGLGRTPTGVGVVAVGRDELPLPPPQALKKTAPTHSHVRLRNDRGKPFIYETRVASH